MTLAQNFLTKAFLQNKNLGSDAAGTAFAKPQWVQADPFGIPPPECVEADWSRDNHNGGYF